MKNEAEKAMWSCKTSDTPWDLQFPAEKGCLRDFA
ncbi:Uncharacterised protein [Escherichia coli]|uniref:Uncharacterized protein n=1 Tax=Escherichia coli TaxID=562 RepID=A0A376KLY2_ECOLX|nr:Uncharacterised protein [Escherichia coli]